MVANAKRHPRDEDVLDGAREQAARISQDVKQEAEALKEQAIRKAEELTRTVKKESDRFLKDQKRRAAERVERIGSVIHQAAGVLKQGEVAKVAEYVDMAAVGATAASKYLEEREVDEIVEDVADLVRRHPVATFGAMVIAGLAVARFVKAGQGGPQGGGHQGQRNRAGGRRK